VPMAFLAGTVFRAGREGVAGLVMCRVLWDSEQIECLRLAQGSECCSHWILNVYTIKHTQ